ncbi:gamma-butyrobetaine dioxygenase-like [Palaemon carinicauda]|uniref:gamma-butyrobetaine dioxygenase-like n=1 Tax=Palaemon carinicauda TaxID=392227 RepID=UPI0035B66243
MALIYSRNLRCLPSALKLFMQLQHSAPLVTKSLSTLDKSVKVSCQFSTQTHSTVEIEQKSIEITTATNDEEFLEVKFTDGTQGDYPYCWLRDNCQCSQCYDHTSFTRRLVLDDWSDEDKPIDVQVDKSGVMITWESGHISHFKPLWLQERSFSNQLRSKKRYELALEKELWGPDVKIQNFDYNAILSDDKALLDWLVIMEKMGITVVKNTPQKPQASFEIINKVGFIKQTHYGTHYPIRNKTGANSLAYTDNKLGMHNDLPYYEYVPGIIFLHCITQFTGHGGENDLADGFWVAEYLKKHHPKEYNILTETPVYFWNKGSALVKQETTEFHKLLNIPLIVLNQDGKVTRVNNSQLRDSFLDVPAENVKSWYQSLRLYNKIMYQEATRFKLKDGETLVMDNTRLLHGRTAYDGALGERYMDQVYLDWDEALSKRRVLQEKYGTYHK